MADHAFLDHLAASPDHEHVLPDKLPRAPEPAPAFPDHVVNFLKDDLAVAIEEGPKEDQDMDIDEEDPEKDQIMDFEVDDEVEEWEDDEDWLIAPVTPPIVAAPVRPNTPPQSFPTLTPLPIDPIMLPDHQITTLDFLSWIPPTQHTFQHSIYEVGGPSATVPKASHPGRHPLSMVASRDALHHQELAALYVRLDGFESIQTELRRSDQAIVRDVGWLGEGDEVIQHRTLSIVRSVDGLSDDRVADSVVISELQPRMATVKERVQTLVEDGEYVQDVLDVVDTGIAELRDVVDDYPRGHVYTLRHKVDGLHGIIATMSHRVQILEIALQEVRLESQDLRTRLSASGSSERCMFTCLLRMEECISVLEQRSPGPQGSSNGSS
ncbi:hypothetical protein Tco_0200055 [Tanacetum coccineum]